jgi:hypothetical protein
MSTSVGQLQQHLLRVMYFCNRLQWEMRHDITTLEAQENHQAALLKEYQATSTCQKNDLNCVFLMRDPLLLDFQPR